MMDSVYDDGSLEKSIDMPEHIAKMKVNCIPEPGKSCKNSATYYVWFENIEGFYGFMCDKHAASAVKNGVRGNRVYQLKSIESDPEINIPTMKINRDEYPKPFPGWTHEEKDG